MSEAIIKLPRPATPIVGRIKSLEAEARNLALDEQRAILSDLAGIVTRMGELATVESLPAGIREAFRTMSDRYKADALNVASIASRVG